MAKVFKKSDVLTVSKWIALKGKHCTQCYKMNNTRYWILCGSWDGMRNETTSHDVARTCRAVSMSNRLIGWRSSSASATVHASWTAASRCANSTDGFILGTWLPRTDRVVGLLAVCQIKQKNTIRSCNKIQHQTSIMPRHSTCRDAGS